MPSAADVSYKYLVLPGNESVLMRDALERRPWWQPVEEGSNAWDFWWGGNGQKFDFKLLQGGPGSQRVVNRLEAHHEVCTKSGLATNLAALLRQGPCPWVPETYILAAKGAGDLPAFRKAYERHSQGGTGTTWIVKPTSLNRGNGIEVFNSLHQILEHVNSKKPGSKWVVQKYIDHPLLVDGRKFDLRAYVLVAPDGSVYLYREAYVRTSSTPYKLDDLSDRAAHLTNDAVQKALDSYNQFEDHCKLRLEELQAMVGDCVDIRGAVWPQMRECVSKLFGLVAPKLNPRKLRHCFELLGLDFMIDQQGQVFLIEVNTSPALFRAGKYLAELLPKVIEEVVQKAVDTCLPPPPGAASPCELLDGFEQIQLASPSISTHSARTHSGSGAATSNGTRMSRTSVSGRGSSTGSTHSGSERRPLPSRVAIAASAGRGAGGTTGGATGATGSGRPSGAGVAGDGAGAGVKGEAGTATSSKTTAKGGVVRVAGKPAGAGACGAAGRPWVAATSGGRRGSGEASKPSPAAVSAG